MADARISRFPVVDPAPGPTDVKEAIDAVTAKSGFTPNVFLAYAWRPEQFLYCTVACGAVLRVLSKRPHIADQVSTNHRHADLTPREAALVEFAVKVTREPAKVCTADLDALGGHGLSDADIWDAGAVASFFNLSNGMATLAALRPNPPFYEMGRNGGGGH